MQSEHENTIPIRLTRVRPSRTDGLTPPPGIDVDYMVRVRPTSEANFWCGLFDESPAGIFVPTYRSHAIGSLVALALEVPGRADLLIVNTVVRWLRDASEASDAPPGIGLEFLNLSARAREAIGRFSKSRPPLLYDIE